MQPPEPSESNQPGPWLAMPPPTNVNPYSSVAPVDIDEEVVVARVVGEAPHRERYPRLWTPIAIVFLSLVSIILLSIVMRAVTVWTVHEGSLEMRQLFELERLKDAFRSRLGLFMLVVVPQLGLVAPSLIAAAFSTVAFRERLGLIRGRWPVWAWIAAAAATPLVGLISSVFFGFFLEESDSLREMGEIFRLHGQGGFLIPLALMIGATPAVCEELLFRGYVQTRLTRSLRPSLGILIASILFAAFHMDFVHAVAVLPLGLFLGWVSWQSGSVFPAMLGHFVNNATSVVLMSFASSGDAATLAMPGMFAVLLILGCGLLGMFAVIAAVIVYGSPHSPRLSASTHTAA